jgi:saccharopine dehydrogenase-like NADP-dependent oxidoreductase
MKTIGIIGGGRVGSYMAKTLAEKTTNGVNDYRVVLADIVDTSCGMPDNVISQNIDACYSLYGPIAEADLIISAVPGAIGAKVLTNVAFLQIPFVDISFMPEDPETLEITGKRVGVVDCGIAPGLCGMIAGHEATVFDTPETCNIYVGGLPKDGGYKAPFSPSDVLEEYMRPARYKEDRIEKTIPALDEVSIYNDHAFVGFVALEQILTDGLRTLLKLPFPNMREYTLRHWGHADQMKMLREMGLFGTDMIRYSHMGSLTDTLHCPLNLTSKLLKELWTPDDDDEEFTHLKVECIGTMYHREEKHVYTLDASGYYNDVRAPSSMALTTGAPAMIVAQMILDGDLSDHRGLLLPEHIGADAKLWLKFRRRLYDDFGLLLTRSTSAC